MTATTSLGCRGVTLGRLAIAFTIICAVYFFRDEWLPTGTKLLEQPEAPPPQKPVPYGKPQANADDISATHEEMCKEAPGAENVLVVLKTGATEIYEKLPTHFLTLFRCTPNYLIFSDLEQTFSDYQIHDAIRTVSPNYKEHHEDFDLYRKLNQYQREGQDMAKLKGDGGWNLDKWKFLPMMHTAHEMATDNIEWFVYIEADTSLSWTNLLQWLKTMDPRKQLYLGAQNVIGDTTFAHGGSGYVVSRAAADKLEKVRRVKGTEVYDERWEELTSTSCCGDEVVARALLAADIPLTPAWPLIQGETVSSIDWTDNHWCTPAITWHHVTPIEIDSMWQFQTEWVDDHDWAMPYLYRDVFANYVERHISVNRTAWNNLSQDKKYVAEALATDDDEAFSGLADYEQKSVESEDACAAACTRKGADECIQWMFSPGRCHLGKDIRLGKSDERESDHWTSGWIPERVEAFKRQFDGCPIRWSG